MKLMDEDAQLSQKLRDLIRLGWAVAEVRGLVDRIALEPSDQGQSIATGGPDGAGKGPLATDDVRSTADRLGWASKNLDSLVSRIREERARAQTGDVLPELPLDIRNVSAKLETTRETGGKVPAWRRGFTDSLVPWDRALRTTLSTWGRRERNAYLFGRELAETYWCLADQAEDGAPDSWRTLLSKDRVQRLTAELSQLGAAVDPRRSRCLQASLERWRDFVDHDGHRKKDDALEYLKRQVQVWQSLLEADTDLNGLRPPTSFVRGVGAGLSVVLAMWAQLAVLTGFTVLLAWGAWLLSHEQHGFLSAIVAAVGAVGVTGSALTTKAKAEGIQLITNVNAAVDSKLDAAATTVVPPSQNARLRSRLYLPGSRTELSVIVYLDLRAASRSKPPKQLQTGRTGQADATAEQAASAAGSSTPLESGSPTVTAPAIGAGAAPSGPSVQVTP